MLEILEDNANTRLRKRVNVVYIVYPGKVTQRVCPQQFLISFRSDALIFNIESTQSFMDLTPKIFRCLTVSHNIAKVKFQESHRKTFVFDLIMTWLTFQQYARG